VNAPRDDHAQRTLEQHALRNVRTLVARLGREDEIDRRRQKRVVIGLCAFAVAVMALLVMNLNGAKKEGGEISRCEVDAGSDVVYEWRREARARDPSVSSEVLEKTISVMHDDVKAEAARRCAGARPAK
jgi:hypothetical protein